MGVLCGLIVNTLCVTNTNINNRVNAEQVTFTNYKKTRHRNPTSLCLSVLDNLICLNIWDLCSIINVLSYV